MSSDELLSALLDGECSPDELKRLLDAAGRDPALDKRWSRMCLVREAMEGTRVRKSTLDFSAGVMAAIAASTAEAAPAKVVQLSSARRPAPRPAVAGQPAAAVRTRRRWQPLTGLATAASIAAVVAVGGYRALNQPLTGPSAGSNPGTAQTASTTTPAAPQNVAVASPQVGLVPVSATVGQVGHWSGSGLDAATARQLDEYLLEHSNMRAAQGMGGALFYPRMAVRTAEYRPGEQN